MIDSKHLESNIPSSKLLEMPQEFAWGLSDDLSTPSSGLTEVDRMVGDFSCSEVRLSLTSGDTSSIISVDIHKNGASIFITPPTIDISGTTSVGATTPLVFANTASTVSISDNTEIKFYVSGATDCLGLKVRLIGNKIINNTYDWDAQAFIDAVGTLSVSQEVAINNLVVGLKTNGTWHKYDTIYPFIGGTAESHKWNLKNPIDSDSAFRLTFYNAWTHNDLGAITDTASGKWADTHYVVSEQMAQNNQHISYYCNTEATGGNPFTMGAYRDNGGSFNGFSTAMMSNLDGGQGKIGLNMNNLSWRNGGPDGLSSMGWAVGTSDLSTVKIYHNLDEDYSSTTFNGGLVDLPIYLGTICYNNIGTTFGGCTERFAFASMGLGLSPTEQANDYAVIQAYQTALGRQV